MTLETTRWESPNSWRRRGGRAIWMRSSRSRDPDEMPMRSVMLPGTGMADLAKAAGITRAGLYKALAKTQSVLRYRRCGDEGSG